MRRIWAFSCGLLLLTGCARHAAPLSLNALDPKTEQAQCDSLFAFFGSPPDAETRPAVRALIGKSPTEIEAQFGKPTWTEGSEGDPDFKRMAYAFLGCPSGASRADRKRWQPGYEYNVQFEFHGMAVRECRVAWPTMYVKPGVVK